jgi:hypothetical protein
MPIEWWPTTLVEGMLAGRPPLAERRGRIGSTVRGPAVARVPGSRVGAPVACASGREVRRLVSLDLIPVGDRVGVDHRQRLEREDAADDVEVDEEEVQGLAAREAAVRAVADEGHALEEVLGGFVEGPGGDTVGHVRSVKMELPHAEEPGEILERADAREDVVLGVLSLVHAVGIG